MPGTSRIISCGFILSAPNSPVFTHPKRDAVVSISQTQLITIQVSGSRRTVTALSSNHAVEHHSSKPISRQAGIAQRRALPPEPSYGDESGGNHGPTLRAPAADKI